MQNRFSVEVFEKYLNDWKELDGFRLGWWLRVPLYLPFGFYLETKNLQAKSKLTKEYRNYLDSLAPKDNLSTKE